MGGQSLFENWRLDGRTALVTAASSGLGRHFAGLLARAGALVVLAARRIDRLEAICAEIVAAGGDAKAVALDVTDTSSITAALAGITPDILVNNAGIANGGKAPFLPIGPSPLGPFRARADEAPGQAPGSGSRWS